MKNVRASVAMAVYNGEKYLPQQIDSILSMLSEDDELVISYDESTDSTPEIIRRYETAHPNVHCVKNVEKPGVSGNFTNAARNCRGKYIFFSDQDDIWMGDKINTMIKALEKNNADLAVHDGYLTDANLVRLPQTLFEINRSCTGPVRNFIKGRFLGCCMAFKAETMSYVLPFPDVTSDFPHDIFATIMVGLKGRIVMVPECFIMHRLHEGNATPKKRNSLLKIAANRMILLGQIIKRSI